MLLELLTGDDPACWAAFGFDVADGAFAVGPVVVRCDGEGGGIRGWTLIKGPGPVIKREVAGIPTTWAEPREPVAGRFGLDHIVLITGRLEPTIADLVDVGWDERRRMTQPQSGASVVFVRSGDVVLEVVEKPGPPFLWGFVAVVEDLASLPADLVGEPKDAVQPGRQIVTARRQEGRQTALAFMTPRVRTR